MNCVFLKTVDQDVRYTAVSSFIFLRFFAPAILSPNLFHLRPHHPVSPTFQGKYMFLVSLPSQHTDVPTVTLS